MNYKLKTETDVTSKKSESTWQAIKKITFLLSYDKRSIYIALFAIIINSGMTLTGPLLVGYTIDHYVLKKDYNGVLIFSAILLGVYIVAAIAGYIQTRTMGAVGQRTLFRLRNSIFTKLQELPIAFFNQNKTGDLISRINNDTDKLNQFFSQTLMQFTGSAFTIIGAGIFIIAINYRLGIASLLPALFLIIFTKLISNWVKRINLQSLRAEGGLSSEIQESLENFKVIIAFNRRDYFKQKFAIANNTNFKSSIIAGLGNNIFMPIYDLASNLAQLAVLIYGIYLISQGNLEIGLLISFLLYIARFYDPLRQFASFWSTLQVALAGWDRISEITDMETDLKVLKAETSTTSNSILRFEDVSFSYSDDKIILNKINFNLKKGKTYALVGPTGGGKTTTASLIARLFDPSKGTIYLDGRDIRTYESFDRTKKIGFILQEPFIFSGSIKENIIYGNSHFQKLSDSELKETLGQNGFLKLLERFESGLETKISGNSESLSLGQKQLIAFMRAVLRNPDLLILDEATANIDTITEQILQEILSKLPKQTTKVIIAHRLNTIESADEIFFVDGGNIREAGSMEHAIDMLLHNKTKS